jgi:hypothetical protein
LVGSLGEVCKVFYLRKCYGLTENVFEGLEGDPIGTHQWYKKMRDKHGAHSVNPYEQVHVGVILSPEESMERKILGISTLAAVFICPEKEGVRQLGMLATILMKRLVQMAQESEAKVLRIAKETPLDEPYGKATSRFVAPGPDKADLPREK